MLMYCRVGALQRHSVFVEEGYAIVQHDGHSEAQMLASSMFS